MTSIFFFITALVRTYLMLKNSTRGIFVLVLIFVKVKLLIIWYTYIYTQYIIYIYFLVESTIAYYTVHSILRNTVSTTNLIRCCFYYSVTSLMTQNGKDNYHGICLSLSFPYSEQWLAGSEFFPMLIFIFLRLMSAAEFSLFGTDRFCYISLKTLRAI